MFTYIHLKHLKRAAHFPCPAEDTGRLLFYRTSPESHCYSNLEVCLRISGEDEAAADVIDGKEFRTPYPHVIFKKPGMHHSFHAGDCREALFFIYSAEAAARLTGDGLIPEHPLQPVILTGELRQLIRRLDALMMLSEEYGSADKIDLVCFAILEELLFQRNMPCNALEDRIRKIASLLQINAESSPDIVKLAEENGFSERSFYRHWKKFFPVTPARYVTEQRMKRAAWLLRHSSLPVGEIAAMLHFCDDNCFSTAFRSFFGTSPRRYRDGGEN